MQTLLSPTGHPPLRVNRFFASLVAHIALLATATVLSRFIVSDREEFDWSRYRVEPLRLRVSVPIFFVSGGEPAGVTAGHSMTVEGLRKAGPTVLEPDYRPEAKLPNSVPPLAHWSRRAPPESPKPDARSSITAGRVEAPSPQPRLSAPPTLSIPNREEVARDVNLSVPPTDASSRRNLIIENGSTLPVRTADSGGARTASFDIAAGQPVNVLALSQDRARQPEIEIDRGLQNVSGLEAAGARGAAPGESVRANRNSISRSGVAAPVESSIELPQAADDPGKSLIPELLRNGLTPSDLKRIDHPANGSYDVVITQSAPLRDSNSAGVSAPGTVYTVYLTVGDTKEWLLEFRGVSSLRPLPSNVHVTIGNEEAITPPYPISTVIAEKLLAEFSSGLVLSGSITADGALRNIRVVEQASRTSRLMLELLNGWRFRPAMQNRKPVDVDVRLVVPPRS